MKRSLVREHVFRIMFRHDFHDTDEFEEQERLYFDEYPSLDDEYPEVADCPVIEAGDRAEIETKVSNIIQNIEEIDDSLSDNCKGWSLNRIGKAELAILRIAVYEIMFDADTDTAVSINEAVNLSKKYCDDKSPSFVNGVLSKYVQKTEQTE